MALMRARESVMAHFRPILAEHDLTEQQWRVLRALIAADAPVAARFLAEETFLLGPSLSRMLVSLDERNLIARSTAASDGRRSEISITDAGRTLVGTVAPLSEAAYSRIQDHFEPGELNRLYELLERAADIR